MSPQLWVPRGSVEKRRGRTDRTGSVAPGDNGGADPALWDLLLNEDFTSPASGTGLAAVDGTRWNVQNNTTASNQDAQYLANNVTVAGGKLRLTGKLENNAGKLYTAGYITTDAITGFGQKFQAPEYFRALVTAKLSFQKGMWCAPLWMRPTDNYGAAEIDMCETYAAEVNLGHYTLHTGLNYTSPASGGDHAQAAYTRSLPNPSGVHTWVVEKIPNKIDMYMDGVIQKSFLRNAETAITSRWDLSFESGRTWDLRCQLQIGGAWPSAAAATPDGSTNWTDTYMEIERVAIWDMV